MIGYTPQQTQPAWTKLLISPGWCDFVNMPFRTYSTGMQLRLAFAVSTSIRPQILVLDEWLSTGDEEFRHRAEKRMKEVVDSTDILILASHSRQLLEENCNRLIWLEHGRIKQDGPAEHVTKACFENAVYH